MAGSDVAMRITWRNSSHILCKGPVAARKGTIGHLPLSTPFLAASPARVVFEGYRECDGREAQGARSLLKLRDVANNTGGRVSSSPPRS